MRERVPFGRLSIITGETRLSVFSSALIDSAAEASGAGPD
jgi:hypothetical protein